MAIKLTDQPVRVNLFERGYDEYGQSNLALNGIASNKTVQTERVASVPAKFVSSGELIARLSMIDGYMQSRNFRTGVSGWQWRPDGDLEANNGTFRGNLEATTGTIGGFNIGATALTTGEGANAVTISSAEGEPALFAGSIDPDAALIQINKDGSIDARSGLIGGWNIEAGNIYGGTLKTGVDVGQVGSNGVILDVNGMRGYSSTYGQVFNIPTNGDLPVFAKGTITEAIVQTAQIVGGEIIGTILTGNTFRTAYEGRRIEFNSDGLQAYTGATGSPYGDNTYKYGDSIRTYGSGVLAYYNNINNGVPVYINQEQNIADIHYFNRTSDPSGVAEVGDTAVVLGELKICTAGGTPGTWTVVGTQT